MDPATFKNWPPVETWPYKLYGVYPELKLFVWERREDYWAKALGFFPAPKYVIWRYAPPPDIDLADFVKGMVDGPLPHIFSWEMIRTATALTPNIVIAPFMDPCPLGVSTVNCDKYPLNLTEVRWAIAYCINKEKLAKIYPMAPRVDVCKYPWPVPAYAAFDKYIPMVERALNKIEEELGFKYEYNPDKAKKILDKLGFIDRDGDGIRETPEGVKLSWEIVSRPPAVINEYYINLDLADELRKIGIDASVRTVDPDMWHELTSLGHYDIAGGSLCTGAWVSGDLLFTLVSFHSMWYVPIGERSMGGGVHGANPRYKNPELDAIVDKLQTLGPEAPEAAELYEKGIYILMKEMLSMPAVEKQFVQVFSTAYWTGWPTELNMYHVPYIWWPEFIFVLFNIKPTAPPIVIKYVGVWFTADVPAFVGVDEKTYGPFVEGAFATIPMEDAERLVKEGLASYAAPIPAEIPAMVEALRALKEQTAVLAGQMTLLTTVAIVEGTAIIVLAALVILVRRKPA